ncbi:MAG: hypothetical protein NC401_18275 [Ruminococcus sp.]|nr:hypothetical protein [Ruminococcus sp.]
MKHKLEKAAHKSFGVILAVAAVPAVIAFVIVWFATGLGGKAAEFIARGNHEKEENYKSDF